MLLLTNGEKHGIEERANQMLKRKIGVVVAASLLEGLQEMFTVAGSASTAGSPPP